MKRLLLAAALIPAAVFAQDHHKQVHKVVVHPPMHKRVVFRPHRSHWMVHRHPLVAPTMVHRHLPRPHLAWAHVPAGATAVCGDGTYWFGHSRRGACSHHGGVRKWLKKV